MSRERVASRALPADWPWREHSRFVEQGSIRWHVQQLGQGPVAVLIHGTGASTHSFRDLMPALAAHFTVVALDLPGHAFSLAPPGFVPSLPSMASAVGDCLATLGLSPRLAVGHSAGAAVLAQLTVERRLEPELLVGLGAALVPFRGVAGALFPTLARGLAQSKLAARGLAWQARGPLSVERLVRGTGSTLNARGVELYRALATDSTHVAQVLKMLAHWDLRGLFDRLGELSSRVLLLAGERDLATPPAQQREVLARLPRGELVLLPGAGHLVHEERPAEVARLILDHLVST